MTKQVEICGGAKNQLMALAVTFSPQEAESILRDWVNNAALVTHPKGNRRYGSFILRVVCNQLQSIYLADPSHHYCKTCYGTGTEKVYDVEQGTTTIPCQTCKKQEDKGVDNERQDAIPARKTKGRHSWWAV